MIKEISIEEYEKMWNDMKGKMCFSNPNLAPELREMTVIGKSGPGGIF